jgi:hypothetical protein
MTTKRVHLQGLVDKYFSALLAHDPSKLPLAKTVKYTENTVTLKPGDALWATASDPPTYKHVFSSVKDISAGCFAVLKENGFPILLALRIKEETGKITELETVVVRPTGNDPPAFTKLAKPNPVFAEEIKPSERMTRAQLIKEAELYFDGIQNKTGDFVHFTDDCHRMENGMITANNPAPGTDIMGAGSAMKCIDQFKTNSFYFITKINQRRYMMVDEERGIVLASAMFVHAGNVLEAEIPGRGKVKTPSFALHPSSVMVSELFKIKNGKIQEIEVVGTMFPYGVKSGW